MVWEARIDKGLDQAFDPLFFSSAEFVFHLVTHGLINGGKGDQIGRGKEGAQMGRELVLEERHGRRFEETPSDFNFLFKFVEKGLISFHLRTKVGGFSFVSFGESHHLFDVSIATVCIHDSVPCNPFFKCGSFHKGDDCIL